MSCPKQIAATLMILLGGLAGCRQPMQVCTDSRLRFSEPVAATVTAHMAAPDRGPLTQMVVQPGSCGNRCGAKVALVDVDGLLVNTRLSGAYSGSENPVALFREKLDAVARDPSICAVLLRINTPGGGVTATDIMWRELQLFRQRTGLPVVACLMDVAAGGGYYLATAADLIYAHPTTVTGGIGVILNHYNLLDTMAQYNIFSEPIKAGKNIDMGTPAEIMPPKVRVWLQRMANEYHQRFTEIVREGRPSVQADQATVFDGRVFTARQALEHGLVDEIGYLDDAIRAAGERSGRIDACVVMYRRKDDPARTPFDRVGSQSEIASNQSLTGDVLPVSIPGLDRSKLPAFLYMWQPEPALERLTGN